MSLRRVFATERRKRRTRRHLRIQPLESRRLLIAEGNIFSFSGKFEATGIIGDAIASVDWGDGTTSPVGSITGGDQTGDLKIRFDYSLDSQGFFSGNNSHRRNTLQLAADSLIKRFGDDLAAITPGGIKEWIPSINHPSSGPVNSVLGTQINLPKNLPVAANEIIIYAGARDLPGSVRGYAGQASYQFPATQISCRTQAECDRKLAEIEAFRNIVRGRGEPGALGTVLTDVAPHLASLSFDSNTNWYFGINADGITPDQLDFLSVATHEIAHILGFGLQRFDVTSSWDNLTSTGKMIGVQSSAAYEGTGSPPVTDGHWANSILDTIGQSTLLSGSIALGKRTPMSSLDMAAMDDLGWDLLDTKPSVTANHRYPDNGQYDVRLVIQGSQAGQVSREVTTVDVTNVAPALVVITDQTAFLGETITLPNIATVTDPGFDNNRVTPATEESFTYTINWGDGTDVDTGNATIDTRGDHSGQLTEASFDAVHTYQTLGEKTVTVAVTDDDASTTERTFRISVIPPPALTLELNQSSINEDAGNAAAMLTVTRSGPTRTTSQAIQLSSSDTNEARLPGSAIIPAGASSVTVPIEAVDDALLDGSVEIDLIATGQGVASDVIRLTVRDRESLSATLAQATLEEGSTVDLVLSRSNTDIGSEILIEVTGQDPSQIDLPAQLILPANQPRITIPVTAIDDNDAEAAQVYSLSFSATHYIEASINLTVNDNEPPVFQNTLLRCDVNDDGRTTAADALRVINEMGRQGGPQFLDPNTELPIGFFPDVNGDYFLSALEALSVINELAGQFNAELFEGEAAIHGILHAVVEDDDLEESLDQINLSLRDQALANFNSIIP